MRPWRRTRPGPAADCHEVARVLQAFLDHEVDDLSSARVAHHLELCRRCGMEAAVYAEIKASLADRGTPVDPVTLRRLRLFSQQLAASAPDPGDGVPPGA